MSLLNRINEAVTFIKSHVFTPPRVGVILGSGLGAFAEGLTERVAIPYSKIPNFPTSGVIGHAGELVLGKLNGMPCAVLSGRVHYYEGHDLERVTFPVRVLAALGVKSLVVTNAAGGVNSDYVPGDFMVITDQLNLTGQNPLRGPNDERLGVRFVDMSQAYDKEAQQLFHSIGQELGLLMRQGVYVGVSGPSYETPAEIRMFQRFGGDAVGMSTVHEVIVARHAGLRVAGLSVITNRAAGLSDTPLSHSEVTEIALRCRDTLCEVLNRTVVRLGVL